MLERVVYPILVCALLSATLALCAYLFLTLKREIYGVEHRRALQTEAIQADLHVLKDRLEDLAMEFDGAGRTPLLPPPNGIHINKRAQALRMVKRGDGPERIAAALNLSPREAELLVKVEKLIAGSAARLTSG